MSRRLMETLGDLFGDIEQYSIDEAFVFPPDGMDFLDFGRMARARFSGGSASRAA